VGYMRGLTHTFGVRRSDKAHRRVGLSQCNRSIPSLIGAEERAILRAIGTQRACRPSPNLSVGIQGQEPGNQFLVVSGTTPGKRRRSFRGGARPSGSVSRLLPCLSCPFRTRDRTARVGWASSDRQRGEALPRPRCRRPADGSSPSGDIFVADRNIIITEFVPNTRLDPLIDRGASTFAEHALL
jgi:hypothetical protein